MSIVKHWPKVLSLSLLGLLTLAVSGAQANWEIEGKELTANESVAAKAHTPWGLGVPAKNFEIKCNATETEGLKLLAKSATAEGKIKLTGCATFEIKSGTELKNCKPKEPIILGIKILMILHNNEIYLLLEPASGTKFTTLEFSELCAITETADLIGTRVDECGHLTSPGNTWVHLDCGNGQPRFFIRPAPKLLFPSDIKLFGKSEVEDSGITELELSGANKGKTWGGRI